MPALRSHSGVLIAEKLAYVTNEELSALYLNLLAKASVFETARFAHPSLVNLINNLSRDEAILLQELNSTCKDGKLPFLEARQFHEFACQLQVQAVI